MRQTTLSGLVKRRFVHCVNRRGESVVEIVRAIGLPPGDLCAIIAGQRTAPYPLETYYRLGRWLHMPLANVMQMAGAPPKLPDLIRLGMRVEGYRPSSSRDQVMAASRAGVSVATFRRALHGYADFSPSLRTCDRLAEWLAWTGFDSDEIVHASGMRVRYTDRGRRVTVSPSLEQEVAAYPCACGRPGCMVPAHIPHGPRRKWRNDACRMWATRHANAHDYSRQPASKSPYPAHFVRFIMINERRFPVRA